ncbi:MAG: MMPL family transporter [Planctomycetes bacterium]|nr:MMPL family transporter [Planctomycetota bacterium]
MSLARRASEAAILGILRWRAAVVLLVLAALGLSYAAVLRAAGAPGPLRPPVDNGIEIWFLEGDEAMKAYRRFQETFGNDEAVLVAFQVDGSVFEPATLALVADVTSRARAVPLVKGVTSLSTVVCFGAGDDGAIEVTRPYRAPLPEDPAAARAVADLARARVTSDPLYRGALVSPDERTTLLTVQLDPVSPREMDLRRGEVLAGVRAAVDDAFVAAGRAPGSWWWGGIGVMNEELNRLSLEDLLRFGGLSTALVLVCLWFALRRVGAVLVAWGAVYLAQTWTLGAYCAAGLKLNLVTMILPTLVMVIGLTDAIYFITIWQQERDDLAKEGLTKREALARCLGFCALPGLFNSVTASVGFLAFVTADMAALRHLGLFAGLGIVLAFVSSVVVCAVALDAFDLRVRAAGDPPDDGLLARTLAALSAFVARRHRAIVWAGAALLAASAAGILRLDVDTYTLGYLRESNQVRRDNDAIEAAFGPYLPLEVVIETGRPDGVKAPAVLQAIDALERETTAREEKVGGSTSIAGVVKRLNEVFHDGDPAAHVVPDDADLIEQELIFYDPQREDDPLQLVDFPRWERARVTFRTDNDSARAAHDLLARLEADAARLLPEGARAAPSGYVPLYVRLIDYLVWGQISSITTSFVVIFVVLLVLFRSWRHALISLPANVIPVALTLGFMGWAGIHLDVATVLIAAVALGLAVDDTIHVVFKFRALELETGDTWRSVDKTLRSTGAAILATSITLALGFSVLGLAQVKSVAVFGALMAVTMIAALIGELLITPAVILTFFARRKGDV